MVFWCPLKKGLCLRVIAFVCVELRQVVKVGG
jgi:hypothetical protein